MISFLIVPLLQIPVCWLLSHAFAHGFTFFNWISEGIAVRKMKKEIPPELLQPLPLPEKEEDISGLLQSPQIFYLSQLVQWTSGLHALLIGVVLLVLIPVLPILFVNDPTGRLIYSGCALLLNVLFMLHLWFGILRPARKLAVQFEKYPELALGEKDVLRKTTVLVKKWNRVAEQLKEGDRKRGVFLRIAGAVLAALVAGYLLFTFLVPIKISSDTWLLRGYEYRLLEDGTAEITGRSRVSKKLTIPNRLGWAQVSVIGEGVFEGWTDLMEIHLPAGLREICSRAFNGCWDLEQLQLPDGIRVIGEEALAFTGLKSVRLPAELKRIDSYAFLGSPLTELELPEGLETLDPGALYCPSLKRVTIPDSLRSIGGNPFRPDSDRVASLEMPGDLVIELSPDHPALKLEEGLLLSRDGTRLLWGAGAGESFSVPPGVRAIESYAFFGNRTMRSLTLPDSILELGAYAFSGCTALESVTLPDSLTHLPESAFRDCTALRECPLPGRLTALPESVFCGCTALQECPLPETLTEIGARAFHFCSSLEKIVLPPGVLKISSSAFANCTSLRKVTLPDTLLEIDNNAFSGCTGLSGVSFPRNLEKIGYFAFSGCTGLTEIALPDSLKELGSNCFIECSALRRVFLPANRPKAFSRVLLHLNFYFGNARDLLFLVHPDSWAIDYCTRCKVKYEVLDE